MTAEDEDDPFACFGDDDDDDDDSIENEPNDNNLKTAPGNEAITSTDDNATTDERARARILMENYANKNKSSNNESNATTQSEITNATGTKNSSAIFHSSYQDQRTRVVELPWPQRPPLYLGPMYLAQMLEEGGGRGYVAMQDLPPGTCVLIEEPFVKGWSEEQMGKRLGLESIHHLLEMENANQIIECMEELHPRKQNVMDVFHASLSNSTSIDPLDKIQIVDMIADMDNDTTHAQQVESLIHLAKERKLSNSDGSHFTSQDINRLLLTLRYNGFDSGLYLHFSMFNHDEDPNCIKFRPSSQDGAQKELPHYSEARTTRHVRKGEALTLHYLENPREVSHATRRRILWDQHRFDIGEEDVYRKFLYLTTGCSVNDTVGNNYNNENNRRNAIFQSELVLGKFPQSSLEEVNTSREDDESESLATSNIEKSLDDLEEMMLEFQDLFKMESDSADDSSSLFDRTAALELTIWELITASQSALGNKHHILLSRCRRLHIDAIELVLSKCSKLLTDKQSVELMARFLPTVQPLLESQRRRLGGDHPNVATTFHDFCMGIQALLSHAPKRLLALKLDDMKTLEQCSRMEHLCRKEKERIERFYPRDVDDILRMVNGIV